MRGLLSLTMVLFASSASAIDIYDRYRSPRNPERKLRQSTELIVLHTTEAPARSSLSKVSDRGECHFCVTEEGQIFRIVDRDREAFHAGRSMWNGREDVDKFSVGIECVGYHNKSMPTVQLAAIRELVKHLQTMYRIPDERVVAHSHVAYGAPNKWQRRRHRGRKRCGMLFAMASVRRMLGLKSRPAFDPDTRRGRLAIGDDYLNSVLYGNIDTMAATYGSTSKPTVVAKKQPSVKPISSLVVKPVAKPVAAQHVAKPVVLSAPQSVAKSGATFVGEPKSIAQLKLGGYVELGMVSKENSAMRIAGSKWNAPDTYYTIRGKVTPGNRIDAAHIEKDMSVWRKK